MIRRLGLLLILLTLVTSSWARSDQVNFVIDGGTAAFPVGFITKGDKPYYAVNGLTQVFRFTRYWNEVTKKTTLIHEGLSIELFLNNKKIKVDNRLLKMSGPVIMERDKIYVPEDFVLKVVPGVIKKAITWDPASKTFLIRSESFGVTGVRYYSYPQKTRIVIDLVSKYSYSIAEKDARTLEITINNAVVDTSKAKASVNDGLVNKISAKQRHKNTVLLLTKGTKKSKLKHFLLKDPYRIVLDFQGQGKKKTSAAKAPKRRPQPKVAPKHANDKKKIDKYRIKTIIIDPGHGGADPGAIGYSGSKEKHIALSIAKKLKRRLTDNLGVRVILTHTSDVFVSLSQRAITANRSGGDLFVSIHCNASLRKSARGHEVYFYNPSASLDSYSLSVARSENAVLKLEKKYNLVRGDDDTALILYDLEQNEFVAVSAQLASFMHKKLSLAFGNRRRLPVKSAPFFVLKYTRMPSVLVEVGFISNKAEERQLLNKNYQDSLVDALYRGIKEYKLDYESKLY